MDVWSILVCIPYACHCLSQLHWSYLERKDLRNCAVSITFCPCPHNLWLRKWMSVSPMLLVKERKFNLYGVLEHWLSNGQCASEGLGSNLFWLSELCLNREVQASTIKYAPLAHFSVRFKNGAKNGLLEPIPFLKQPCKVSASHQHEFSINVYFRVPSKLLWWLPQPTVRLPRGLLRICWRWLISCTTKS